jgi:hypothetical protein
MGDVAKQTVGGMSFVAAYLSPRAHSGTVSQPQAAPDAGSEDHGVV